ncbi:MAG: DUF1987 domain-containing protein [Bacteroidota bacterium]
MKNLNIDDDLENEPKVLFNAKNGICTISGHCYPEDAHLFFERLSNWFKEYFEQVKGPISFIIKLKYFNTSSSRSLFRLLTLLKGYQDDGGEVEVAWHYDEGDEYMLEEIIGYGDEANISIEKIPKSYNLEKESAIEKELMFDGIWIGSANVTLIKQLKGYVILQGKDKASTFSAHGVINGNELICRGNGITNTEDHFVYESTMVFKREILTDKWKTIFPDGKVKEGKYELKLIN